MIQQEPSLRYHSQAYLTEAGADRDRPPAVGQKFDTVGGALPYAGNTFICHVRQASNARPALTEASLALQAGPVAGAFSYLPPSSAAVADLG